MNEHLASAQCRYADDLVVVALQGEFDIATVDVLAGALQTACDGGSRHVTVDLGDVEFFGLAALDLVLDAHRRLAGGGCTLNVIRTNPSIDKLMSVLDLAFLAAPVSVTLPGQQSVSLEAVDADVGLEKAAD
jgi:anti-anti-sigma factor